MLLHEFQLQELRQDPTSIRAWADSADLSNVLVGFEFELVIPYQHHQSNELDQPIRDFDDLIMFFGDVLNSRDTDVIKRQYFKWLLEQVDVMIENEANEYLELLEDLLAAEPSFAGLSGRAIDDQIRAGGPLDPPVFREVADEARTTFAQRMKREVLSFPVYLKSHGVATAFDAIRFFEIPEIIPTNQKQKFISTQKVADKLAADLGFENVQATTTYHDESISPQERKNYWIVEPDVSIEPPSDNSQWIYAGYEIVSPALPFADAISALENIAAWAKKNKYQTNNSTGLHINISVPGYSTETLDYIKLVVFSGDTRVLDQFERNASGFAMPALEYIELMVRNNGNWSAVAGAIEKIKSNMLTAASKSVKNTKNPERNISINPRDSYVEFRGPGGNYLGQEMSLLTDTVKRFARALTIAVDPQAEQKEYAKKLTKLLNDWNPNKKTNTVSLFSMYAAGLINSTVLKNRLKSKKNSREQMNRLAQELEGIDRENQ